MTMIVSGEGVENFCLHNEDIKNAYMWAMRDVVARALTLTERAVSKIWCNFSACSNSALISQCQHICVHVQNTNKHAFNFDAWAPPQLRICKSIGQGRIDLLRVYSIGVRWSLCWYLAGMGLAKFWHNSVQVWATLEAKQWNLLA